MGFLIRLLDPDFFSFGHIARGRIARSFVVLPFNFLKNAPLSIVAESVCISTDRAQRSLLQQFQVVIQFYSLHVWEFCFILFTNLLFSFVIFLVSYLHSVQFSAVAQLCLTLCNPVNHSMLGLPVHHQLLEFTQTHWLSDAIQPSHPLLSPSHPAPNPSQHQSLFQWVNSSHEVAKVLEFLL